MGRAANYCIARTEHGSGFHRCQLYEEGRRV